MNKKGGLAAGALVFLGILGISNLPKNSESPAAAESKSSTGPVTTPAKISTQPYSPCLKIAERLLRFVNTTNEDPATWQLPIFCYDPKEQVPKQGTPVKAFPNVRFAVATVPNPVSTHLPLSFDRIAETIQQAAQDDGYSYDASWFPWEETKKEYTHLSDQQTAERLQDIQQDQPGVMVFRRSIAKAGDPLPYENGLVVFLVGEQPTGGISDAQFEDALGWIKQLGGFAQPTLRILGPTFSGSLPSLQRDLDRDLRALELKGQLKIEVSSGTVSSGPYYQWFRRWIEEQGNGSDFWTALESDTLTVGRFCQYLTAQTYDLKYVALLSEDETAFGRTDQTCGDAINLLYPRDIATLRSAYERQSILSSAKPQSNASSPSTTLRGDLSEPASSNHDTVRSYGGQLTPLAQESLLLDITHRLNDHRIQFIILRSTSSLDQIFLSEFLRRSYPGGRVVIDGADLLFTRGAEGRSLHGVMLLSTYPLITSEQDWTPSLLQLHAKSYRIFEEDNSEAAYISARELFRMDGAPAETLLKDYAPPAWAVNAPMRIAQGQRPPTWLSVISHGRIWPLAVLSKNETLSILPDSFDRKNRPLFADGDATPLRFPTAMWIFLIVFVVWGIGHAYFCWNGSIMGSPRARSYFAPVPQWQHSALIALGSVLIAVLAVVVAASSGLLWWGAGAYQFDRPRTGMLLAISLLLGVALAFVGCRRNYQMAALHASPMLESNMEIQRWHRRAAWTAIGYFMIFVLVHIYLVSNLTNENAIPAFWRSVNLSSGVSPLLPQLLLVVGAYLWFWCSLRGLAHFGDDRPSLPKLDDLPSDGGISWMPMFSQEEAGQPIEQAARPLTRSFLTTLFVVFILTLCVCAIALPAHWIRTLGERAFGELIFVWVCLCVAVILTDGIQMWWAWNKLRPLLVILDRLPLRRTLRALKGLAWGSIWKFSGNVLDERYRVYSLQFESLRHLTNATEKWAPDDPAEVNNRIMLLRGLDRCRSKADDFARWYVSLRKNQPIDVKYVRDFQAEVASTAGLVMQNVLIPEWRKETNSLIVDRSRPLAEGADKPTKAAISIDKLPLHVTAAEEFFVLPYLAFIQNILGRIRTIALGSLWLFVGATLAVSSYPFDPLNVLGGIFLTVFAVYGGLAILVYAQMSRDATLSNITDTQPGELGWEFWERLLAFGIGPLIGLLTTLFPSITDFVFSWLQPSTELVK